jgi:hypothetical protein
MINAALCYGNPKVSLNIDNIASLKISLSCALLNAHISYRHIAEKSDGGGLHS